FSRSALAPTPALSRRPDPPAVNRADEVARSAAAWRRGSRPRRPSAREPLLLLTGWGGRKIRRPDSASARPRRFRLRPSAEGGVSRAAKGADCKSAGYAFVGSSPTSPTIAFLFACVCRIKPSPTAGLRLAGGGCAILAFVNRTASVE